MEVSPGLLVLARNARAKKRPIGENAKERESLFIKRMLQLHIATEMSLGLFLFQNFSQSTTKER